MTRPEDEAAPPTRAERRALRAASDGALPDELEHTVLGARRAPEPTEPDDETVLVRRAPSSDGPAPERGSDADELEHTVLGVRHAGHASVEAAAADATAVVEHTELARRHLAGPAAAAARDLADDDLDHTMLAVRRAAEDLEPDDDLDLTRIAAPAVHAAPSTQSEPDDDVDLTRLVFRPRPDDDPDDTLIGVRRDQADTSANGGRVAEEDDTWLRGDSGRRPTLTGEPTQAASVSVPAVIEAPRRRANFGDDTSEPVRAAVVPAVIDVIDVYPPRAPHDPLAGHIAMEGAVRGPQQPVDGAQVRRDQHRRSRRRLVTLVASIVVVWAVAAVGLVVLVTAWPFG